MSKTYRVSVYNTISKQYEEVFLNPQLYAEYIRSEWRILKSERREIQRTVPISALQNSGNDDIERIYLADYSSDPLDIIIQSETSDKLNRALNKLDSMERKIISEIYLQEKTERQVAIELNKSQTTINYQKNTALKK